MVIHPSEDQVHNVCELPRCQAPVGVLFAMGGEMFFRRKRLFSAHAGRMTACITQPDVAGESLLVGGNATGRRKGVWSGSQTMRVQHAPGRKSTRRPILERACEMRDRMSSVARSAKGETQLPLDSFRSPCGAACGCLLYHNLLKTGLTLSRQSLTAADRREAELLEWGIALRWQTAWEQRIPGTRTAHPYHPA